MELQPAVALVSCVPGRQRRHNRRLSCWKKVNIHLGIRYWPRAKMAQPFKCSRCQFWGTFPGLAPDPLGKEPSPPTWTQRQPEELWAGDEGCPRSILSITWSQHTLLLPNYSPNTGSLQKILIQAESRCGQDLASRTFFGPLCINPKAKAQLLLLPWQEK